MPDSWKCSRNRLSFRCLTVILAQAIAACASAPPVQKAISHNDIAATRVVIVESTYSGFDVIYSRDTPPTMLSGVSVAGNLLEALGRNSEDSQLAERIARNVSFQELTNLMSRRFIARLEKEKIFASIDIGEKKNAVGRHDEAIINISTRAFLFRAGGGSLRLGVSVHAVMEGSGGRGKLWDRSDTVYAEESHTLVYYEERGLPMLEAVILKIADRLSDDIIYSR